MLADSQSDKNCKLIDDVLWSSSASRGQLCGGGCLLSAEEDMSYLKKIICHI